MAAKRRILTSIILVGAISFLAACGGSSSSSSTSTTQPAVSIALTPPPTTTTISVGSTAGIAFTPVVSNDPSNSGVDWAITCGSVDPSGAPSCGYLSICPPPPSTVTCSLHSDGKTAVTYLPPAVPYGDVVSSNGALVNTQIVASQTANITAFATADHTKNVTTKITVNAPYVNVLKGTYVFQVRGGDSDSDPYQATGVIVLDGNGNIISGQERLNSIVLGFSTAYTLQGSSGFPSSYFIGPDGRGTITLSLTDGAGNTFQETFSLVVLSSSQALIAELDASASVSGAATSLTPAPFGGTSAGTLELQDTAAAATLPSGAYAFVASGIDSGGNNGVDGNGPAATGFGGVLNIDTPAAISGNGSLIDQDYFDVQAHRTLLSCAPPTGVTGTVSHPNSLGAVTITLNTCLGPTPIIFAGYIVDASHIRLIETDDLNGTAFTFMTAGIAVGQGAAAGTFTDASLSGQYLFGVLGYDINDLLPSSFTSVGVVDPNGNGGLNGFVEAYYPGVLLSYENTLIPSTSLNGSSYSVDPSGIGRADLALVFPQGTPKPRPTLLFYLTGSGTAPLVLWAGGEDAALPAIGAGIAYPEAANPSTFDFGNPESYGVSFTQQLANFAGENDGTGKMTSTISGTTGTLNGEVDDLFGSDLINYSSLPPIALSDTFSPPADIYGRISGTFLFASSAGTNGPFVDYFLTGDSTGEGFLIETDLTSINSSYAGQVAFGYFAQACDVTAALTSPTGCQTLAGSSRRAASGRRSSHVLQGTLLKKNSK